MKSQERLIRMPEVERLTGLKKTSIYDLEAKKQFPSRRKVSPTRATVWLESQVLAWIEDIAAGRDASIRLKAAAK